MIIALCVDNRMGLLFNRRRLSKDSALRQKLLDLSGGDLRMSAYSAKQFDQPVYAAPDYLSASKPGQWCFCEDTQYLDHAEQIQRIVLFKWNRDYPAEVNFALPGQWRLECTT